MGWGLVILDTPMHKAMKARVDRELDRFAEEFNQPPLSGLPEPFRAPIEAFVRRKGKRIRSLLFVIAYRAYTDRRVKNLYRSAASLELLHDFILIHDDLIDRAATRRGEASMHASLDKLLKDQPSLRFRGSDLALIVGDMLYAQALHGFLSISEDAERKQKAFDMLTRTALYTGCGELDELLHTLKPMSKVTRDDVMRIYDWKTGYYTFSAPLAMGATLAGAGKAQVNLMLEAGKALGRAFQIRDDLIDLCGDGARFGKPGLADLKEGKKTLPVLFAFRACKPAQRRQLVEILENPKAGAADIRRAATIISESGAPEETAREMARLVDAATDAFSASRMRPKYRDFLIAYTSNLLQPPDPS